MKLSAFAVLSRPIISINSDKNNRDDITVLTTNTESIETENTDVNESNEE